MAVYNYHNFRNQHPPREPSDQGKVPHPPHEPLVCLIPPKPQTSATQRTLYRSLEQGPEQQKYAKRAGKRHKETNSNNKRFARFVHERKLGTKKRRAN
jgi:hypothetical protein